MVQKQARKVCFYISEPKSVAHYIIIPESYVDISKKHLAYYLYQVTFNNPLTIKKKSH